MRERSEHLLEGVAGRVLLPLVQRCAADAAYRQQHGGKRTLLGLSECIITGTVKCHWGCEIHARSSKLAFKMARPMPPSTPTRQYFHPVLRRTQVM